MLIRYVAIRTALVVPTLIVIAVLNFTIVSLAPGDPARALAGEMATPEYVEALRHRLGLDQSLPVRLAAYLGDLLRGNLGYSFSYQRSVASLILERLPATLSLVLLGELTGAVLGVLLGTVSARRFPGRVDTALSSIAAVLYAIPVFWLGMVLMLGLALHLRWLPTSGFVSFNAPLSGAGRWFNILWHAALPAVTMCIFRLPIYYRVTRASLLEVVHEDFMTTVRAFGLPDRRIYFFHALRNALLPIVTLIGLTLGASLSGALVLETLFSWPGIGRLMFDAVFQRDFPVVTGVFLIAATVAILAVLVTDVIYALIDPRVRYGSSR